MRGKRYEEVWTSQAQVEKAMLGVSPWSPTCLAREEAATSDWAADMWMRAAELMKTAMQNDDCGVATIILRERAERWKQERGGEEANE